MDPKQNIKAEDWINELLSKGKHAFTLEAIRIAFSNQKNVAIKSSLKRLVDKELIISIHKGYYLIIPPQYKSKGILPPVLYLDGFMKELKRPYYLALLNAAAYHGASHQQPQEFFVVTNFPVLRPTQKKGLKVNYLSKDGIPEKLLEIKKTDSGYLKISNPILTAIDLIQYAKRVGGINRVTTILYELMESIKPESFDNYLLEYFPVSALQRLGYLLDKVLDNQLLANKLYKLLQNNKTKLYPISLKTSASVKGFTVDEKWRVIVNTIIETDF